MSKGLLAGDNIAMAIEQAGAGIRAEAQARENFQQTQDLIRKNQRLASDVAANLAEKYALRNALAKIDPKHPLLVNKALQERIQGAGERALVLSNSFDAAREAGETFQY